MQSEVSFCPLYVLDLFIKHNIRLKLHRLINQAHRQILREDFRETTYVKDILLWV